MIVKVQFNGLELNMFKGKKIEQSAGYSIWIVIKSFFSSLLNSTTLVIRLR